MRKFARFILWLMRWKIDETSPKGVKKCVVVMGPHTSNWDFIIGRLAFSHFGVKGKFLIKKEAFFFPFGYILKAMGGIPVNRGKSTNLIDQAVQYFDERDRKSTRLNSSHITISYAVFCLKKKKQKNKKKKKKNKR